MAAIVAAMARSSSSLERDFIMFARTNQDLFAREVRLVPVIVLLLPLRRVACEANQECVSLLSSDYRASQNVPLHWSIPNSNQIPQHSISRQALRVSVSVC